MGSGTRWPVLGPLRSHRSRPAMSRVAGRLRRAGRIRNPVPGRVPGCDNGALSDGGQDRADRRKGRMEDQTGLREHLLDLLSGGHAHVDFERAIAGLPEKPCGARPPGLPHTPWRLVEHLRIAQWDILRFSIDPGHVSPEFPGGYWPEGDAPPDPLAWNLAVEAFRADLRAMMESVADPGTDLSAPLPHGQGQTVLREALPVADHNAYHLGQL